jgi:ATP-dependent Clp protease ATP-binding subunit ClpB
MIQGDEHVVPFLLKKLNVNIPAFNKELDNLIDAYSKVSGGQPYLSNDAQNALQKALVLIKDFKDEFVSLEHLLLGILSGKDGVAKLLKQSGVNEADLRIAIKDLRKGGRVTSASAEETYNSLEKYARNLNQLAREGKAGSGNRSGRRNQTGTANTFPTYKKQPRIDRRTRRR